MTDTCSDKIAINILRYVYTASHADTDKTL